MRQSNRALTFEWNPWYGEPGGYEKWVLDKRYEKYLQERYGMSEFNQKLFTAALIFHPRRVKKDEDEGVYKKSEILWGPETFLARDEKEATILACRKIPQSYIDEGNVDRIEVAIRPF